MATPYTHSSASLNTRTEGGPFLHIILPCKLGSNWRFGL
jgi:hypothetical protein